jgi:hypothetical protein
VAGACQAVGRLVVLGVGGSRPAAATTARSAGAQDATAPAASVLAQLRDSPRPVATVGLQDVDDGSGLPIVGGALAGLPTDAPLLSALAVGMILFVLTALAVYALTARRAALNRQRSLLHGARAAYHDRGGRGDVIAVFVLVVVSLAVWSAITLWILMGGA